MMRGLVSATSALPTTRGERLGGGAAGAVLPADAVAATEKALVTRCLLVRLPGPLRLLRLRGG